MVLMFVVRWICWDVLHHICHKIWAPKVEAGKSFERFNLRPFGSGFTFLLQDLANIWRKNRNENRALETAVKKIGTKFVSRQFVTNWCNLM